MTDRRIAYRVRGHVQGVGFRWATSRAAKAAGVTGFVCNESDGSVSGEAEGAAGALAEFAAFLRKGPRGSRVDEVEERELPGIGDRDFVIRR